MHALAARCGASASTGRSRVAPRAAAVSRCGGPRCAARRAPLYRSLGAAARSAPSPSPLRRAASAHGRGLSLARAATADDGAADALPDAVANAITGSTPEDVECLDEIMSAGAWDDVQQCVRELAMTGRLGPGVLGAAESVLARMQADPATDADLVRSVASVVELLKATLEALARLAPKAKLAESLTSLDPNIPAERALMKELMDLAFDAETGFVDRVDFMEDMVYFVQSSDERDAGFLAAVAEGLDLGGEKLEDIMLVRRQGRDRMSQIVDMLYGRDSPAGEQPKAEEQPKPESEEQK